MINTLEQRKTAAAQLLRVKTEKMTTLELDLAMALLLQKTICDDDTEGCPVKVLRDGVFVPFAPTSDWNDHGEVISNIQLVTGSHAEYEDDNDPERVTGHYYSCHGYYGGVKAVGIDLRRVVGRTCALLLEHAVQYSPEWGNS